MKHIKLFKENKIIDKNDFPEYGHDLSRREMFILNTLVGRSFVELFDIKIYDNYYYLRLYFSPLDKDFLKGWKLETENVYEFDGFNELKNYLCLRYYLKVGQIDKLKDLLKNNKIDHNLFEEYLLFYACLDNKIESVKFLLDNTDVDPSWSANACIIKSTQKGYKEIVKILLQDPRVRAKLRPEKIKEYETS